MSIQINKRVMTYFIAVALLCCVIIVFAPSIRFIPANNVHLRQAALTASSQPMYEISTTDNNAESKIHEDVEFHAKQGGSVKLDFNRLALEGMNSLGAGKSSEISDANAAGPNESLGVGKSSELSDSNPAGPKEGLVVSDPVAAPSQATSMSAEEGEKESGHDPVAAPSQATSMSAEEGEKESGHDGKKLNVHDETPSEDSQKTPSQV